jgi:hypothetical protein
MTDQPISAGLSRRELMRRSAAIAAAVAVATPAVQSLGSIAAFAETSPPPGDGPEVEFPSHFQLLFTVDGGDTVYGIAWSGSWGRIGGPPNGAGSRCFDPSTYTDASSDQIARFASFAPSGSAQGVFEVVDTAAGRGSYVLEPAQLVAGGFRITQAATFDGQFSGGYSGKCLVGVQPDPSTGRYTFSKP